MFGICGTSKANVVIPAQAGIQHPSTERLDPCLRGGDEKKIRPNRNTLWANGKETTDRAL
jgi:hypothetical protein